jgi:hypothetical protein
VKYVIFPKIIIISINVIIFYLMLYSIKTYKYYDRKDLLIITINIVLELLFNFFFFYNIIFLMFASKLLEFISSIYLNEIIYTNKKSVFLLTPFILWNFLLTLFTTTLLFLIV